MARLLTALSEIDLERALLRKSVGTLAADRVACVDCRRTPLVGERVHRTAAGAAICELCAPGHSSEPMTIERVHHAERGITVRRIAASTA